MQILINWIISAMVIFSISYIVPGVKVDTFTSALVVALVLGIINAFLKPVLLILTLPINVLSLGLFTLILNALLILLVDRLVPGFEVGGFFQAFIFGIVLTLANTFINHVYKK